MPKVSLDRPITLETIANMQPLTLREVAELVGRHPDTIRIWIKQGKIPGRMRLMVQGYEWVFLPLELYAWMVETMPRPEDLDPSVNWHHAKIKKARTWYTNNGHKRSKQ